MNSVELDFEQAKAKHLLFKSRLRSILYGLTVDEAPVLSHFECGVGKWIYGHALEAYGQLPEMQELERTHADIHTSARRLVALYRAGEVEEARQGLSEMEQIADRLVGLLDTLEDQLRTTTPVPGLSGETYVSLGIADFRDLLSSNQELDKRIQEQVAATAQATAQLDQQTALLRAISDNADVALFMLDGEQRCVFMNPAAEQLTGFTLDQMRGREMHEFIHSPVTAAGAQSPKDGPLGRALTARTRSKGEEVFSRPDGAGYPVAFTASPIPGPDGLALGTVIEVRDLTEQRQASAALQESEHLFRTITNVAPVGLFFTDEQGKVVYANQTILDWLGLSMEAYMVNAGAEAIVPEDLPRLAETYVKAFTARAPYQEEVRIHHADGTIHWCQLTAVPRYRNDGGFAGYVGSFADFTDRKASEEQLKQYYDDLELKVTFRNLDLERQVRELRARLGEA